MVSGPWDFAGVLCALSGFLLVGGPCLLTGLNKQWRSLWLMGQLRDVTIRSSDWWHLWIALWSAYFVLVVGGAAFLLWQRRRTTVIYNIDPQQLDDVLDQVLSRLGLPATRVANRIFIRAKQEEPVNRDSPAPALPVTDTGNAGAYDRMDAGQPHTGTSTQAAPAQATSAEVELMLQVDAFPALRHATLFWNGQEELTRKQVELELGRQLNEVHTPESPVGGWLLTISASLFSIAFVCLLLLVGYLVLFYFR
jgi:hypothetical protein